jgi:beta-lactamase superfamily II metal-dependent hydrolase
MLFDCGHNERTGFRPSSYLPANGCTGIEYLIIQNFDQDHVSDLPNVISRLPVTVFIRNGSVSPQQLQTLKLESGPLTAAMETALAMHRDYVHPVTNPPLFPNIVFETFCNEYPAFKDTNNLSLVSFIHCDGMGIVFPGDLEKAGWESLLLNPAFRVNLSKVQILVASHHGRVDGYCKAVFDYCAPDIVIISDKEIAHDTQEDTYANHASGVVWSGGPQKRYVLTTRSDGMITISKNLSQGYYISV